MTEDMEISYVNQKRMYRDPVDSEGSLRLDSLLYRLHHAFYDIYERKKGRCSRFTEKVVHKQKGS
jgi:hypothetical protein